IISNPRITTLNNKAAKMFVGMVYNYISEMENDKESDTVTYNIEKEEIGIRLAVTPHVNAAGDIEVELKPEIKDVVGSQQITEFFSLPIFTTREAETQVMVRDSETIFIGGMIRENISKFDKKFPVLGDLLGDVPWVGPLFKFKTETRVKTELIFFLTVHIVKDVKEFNRNASSGLTDLKIFLEPDEGGVEIPVKKDWLNKKKPTPEKKHEPYFNFSKNNGKNASKAEKK
ncbi:MAG: type II and III secretion system protein, partial [Candidatus Omnitrophota bacterium]